MKIAEFIHPDSISIDLIATGKTDVLAELAGLLETSCDSKLDATQITTALVERERLATTGIGEGVAIPHAKIDNLDKIVGAIGLTRTGIQFDAVDNQPVHIFVALMAPQESTGEHLKALAGISRLLKDKEFRSGLLECTTASLLYEAIVRRDNEE